ncbi:MAG TPA: hypothetical protein VFT45_21805 [Longimicrobium sp.]|nr:hypothetical protein [Longimicrobium sp.]
MSDQTSVPPPVIAELQRDPRAVPLAYGYLRVAPTSPFIQRVGHSAWHRAGVYACTGFHKTISRCLNLEG